MRTEQPDGSAGDVDYGVIGRSYSRFRQPDSRIAALILAALGDAKSVLNVGAGAGSYEPVDRDVVAVEPSASMRAQRPQHLSRAIDAVAEALPFPAHHFDASMAIYTVHQWSDVQRGLQEMRRVARCNVLILTCDPQEVQSFWLNDYAPEVLAAEARRYPAIDLTVAALGGACRVIPVPIPLDCQDGFNEAYFGRPEFLLDADARLACSAWSFVDAATAESYVEHLRRDLESGTWDDRYGDLRHRPSYGGSLRLIVSSP